MFRCVSVLISLLAFASCASPRIYHVEVGPRYESYSETPSEPIDTALSRVLQQPVFTISGNNTKLDLKGVGGQIALRERMGPLVTRLALFFTSYDSLNYVFQVPTVGKVAETVSCKTAGLDAAFGYQIGWFRPQLSYKLQSLVTSLTVTNPGGTRPDSSEVESETQFLVGGGLALDIPISHQFRIAAQGDYRVPLTGSRGVHEITVQAGLLFGGWEIR